MSERCLICDLEFEPGVREQLDPADPKGPWRAGIVQRFEGLPPAFYCPWHAGKVKKPKPRPKRFRLKRDERAELLSGGHPRIERSRDELQAIEGEVVTVTALVEIVIGKSGVNKRGKVQYRYAVRDQRLDKARLLRRKPPALRPEIARHDRVHPPTPVEERQAAEESAYAAGGSRETLITDAGEAPSRLYESEIALRSRLRHAERIKAEIVDEAA